MARWLAEAAAWAGRYRTAVRALLWGVLGFSCFAAAGALTWTIAHVGTAMSAVAPDRLELDSSGWYVFNVVGSEGETGRATMLFDYTTEDEVAVLSFQLPPGAKSLMVRDYVQGRGCRRQWPGRSDPRGDPLPWRDAGPYTEFIVEEAAADPQSLVECNVWPRYRTDAFTTIVSAFYNDNGSLTTEPGNRYLPVELIINGRDGPTEITATNRANPGDVPLLLPGGLLTVRFHSMRAEEARDWYILWIGVLVGFGAAMLIECIRPVIESIGRSSDGPVTAPPVSASGPAAPPWPDPPGPAAPAAPAASMSGNPSPPDGTAAPSP